MTKTQKYTHRQAKCSADHLVRCPELTEIVCFPSARALGSSNTRRRDAVSSQYDIVVTDIKYTARIVSPHEINHQDNV